MVQFKSDQSELIFSEFKKRLSPDVVLISGGLKVWCHRLLLAAASPVLCSLLRPFSAEEDVAFSLPGCSGAELRQLTRFLYGDDLYTGREDIPPILKHLQVSHLKPVLPNQSEDLEIRGKEEYLSTVAHSQADKVCIFCGEKTSSISEHIKVFHKEFVDLDLNPNSPCIVQEKSTTLQKPEPVVPYNNNHCDFSSQKPHDLPDGSVRLSIDISELNASSDFPAEVRTTGKSKAYKCLFCPHMSKKIHLHVFTQHRDRYEEYKRIKKRRTKWPKQCEYCDRMLLVNKDKMERHYQSHWRKNDIRRNQEKLCCQICSKDFGSPELFQTHCMGIHWKINCPVQFCRKNLSGHKSLGKHMLEAHKTTTAAPIIEIQSDLGIPPIVEVHNNVSGGTTEKIKKKLGRPPLMEVAKNVNRAQMTMDHKNDNSAPTVVKKKVGRAPLIEAHSGVKMSTKIKVYKNVASASIMEAHMNVSGATTLEAKKKVGRPPLMKAQSVAGKTVKKFKNVTRTPIMEVYTNASEVPETEAKKKVRPPLLMKFFKVDDKYPLKSSCSQRPKDLHKELGKKKAMKCRVCDKEFVYAASLQKHQLLHKEDTDACAHCDQRFNSRHNLNAHMKLHAEASVPKRARFL